MDGGESGMAPIGRGIYEYISGEVMEREFRNGVAHENEDDASSQIRWET